MLTVGIDLGTTNSVVATVRGGAAEVLADEYGDRLTPSVVNFHPSGKIIVGAGARARKRVDPQHTIFSTKRLLGYPFQSAWVQDMVPRLPYRLIEGENSTTLIAARGNTYTLPEVSALILRRLREVAIMQTGAPIERAVITVPAHFNELQRAATKVAGRIAGLEVMRVINEPTAAALAYFRDGTSRKRVVVYDFGGGTFDCTVLDLSEKVYEVLATCGDSFLGGDDVDTAIALRMRENLLRTARLDAASDPALFDRMRSAAEELKITLSSQQSAQTQLQEVGFGTLGRAIHLDFGMTVQEYNQILTPFLDRTIQKTQEALSLAGVSASGIDHVILVGGSTRSPLVQARLRDFFGQSPLQHVNVEHAVAIGAAYQAAALSDVAKRRTIPEPPPVFDPARQGSLPPHTNHDPRHTLPMDAKIPGAATQPGRTSSMPPLPGRTSSMPPLPERTSPMPGRVSSVPPARTAPILVDVTPRALVVETAGGFCDTLIPRNARIPCGRARQFSMGKDFQTFVRIRVAQGEAARFNDNTYLGEVVLSGLRAAPRGEVVLSVSFDLDEGGLLRVSAKDLATTQEAHAVLQLVGFAGSVEGMQLRLAQSTVSARSSVVPPQR